MNIIINFLSDFDADFLVEVYIEMHRHQIDIDKDNEINKGQIITQRNDKIDYQFGVSGGVGRSFSSQYSLKYNFSLICFAKQNTLF